MRRLGFKKYYAQGGDWGSAIGSNMATLFPDVSKTVIVTIFIIIVIIDSKNIIIMSSRRYPIYKILFRKP